MVFVLQKTSASIHCDFCPMPPLNSGIVIMNKAENSSLEVKRAKYLQRQVKLRNSNGCKDDVKNVSTLDSRAAKDDRMPKNLIAREYISTKQLNSKFLLKSKTPKRDSNNLEYPEVTKKKTSTVHKMEVVTVEMNKNYREIAEKLKTKLYSVKPISSDKESVHLVTTDDSCSHKKLENEVQNTERELKRLNAECQKSTKNKIQSSERSDSVRTSPHKKANKKGRKAVSSSCLVKNNSPEGDSKLHLSKMKNDSSSNNEIMISNKNRLLRLKQPIILLKKLDPNLYGVVANTHKRSISAEGLFCNVGINEVTATRNLFSDIVTGAVTSSLSEPAEKKKHIDCLDDCLWGKTLTPFKIASDGDRQQSKVQEPLRSTTPLDDQEIQTGEPNHFACASKSHKKSISVEKSLTKRSCEESEVPGAASKMSDKFETLLTVESCKLQSNSVDNAHSKEGVKPSKFESLSENEIVTDTEMTELSNVFSVDIIKERILNKLKSMGLQLQDLQDCIHSTHFKELQKVNPKCLLGIKRLEDSDKTERTFHLMLVLKDELCDDHNSLKSDEIAV